MNCFLSSCLTIAVLSSLCSWTFARLYTTIPPPRKGQDVNGNSVKATHSMKFDASLNTNLLNVECHVGALCTLQNEALSKLDKTLVPSWLMTRDNMSSSFYGIPSGNDVGTHILPEIGLVVQVTYSARELAFPCRPYRTSPTVAVISIDADLPVMPPADRISLFSRLVNLLRSGSPYIDLKSIHYLSKAVHQPESLKSLFMLATGPGNTHSLKTNGSLLAWRVGCGSVAPSQLHSLQRLEKTAVTGELARIIGYPVRQWFVADDKRVMIEARRLRRNRMRRSPNIDQWGPTKAMYSKEEMGSGYAYETFGNPDYSSGYMYPTDPETESKVKSVSKTTSVIVTDTLPIVKKPLPFYMVKQNVKGKKFRIPEHTFFDQEDGNTPNLKLELLTKDQIPAGNMEPRWLTLDSASQMITVIDPSLVPRGNHSFSLVAYDSKENRVSQILVIRVLSPNSEVPMDVIKFEIRPGEYFEKFLRVSDQALINHNIDDEKNLLSFNLRQINPQGRYFNATNPWVRFDADQMKFYGFATLDLTEFKTNFRLSVRMKYATKYENSPSGFFRVEITITSRRQQGLTHSIGMNVTNPNFSADEFLRDPWLQLGFIKRLKKVFSEKKDDIFIIQNVAKTYRRRYRRQIGRRSYPRDDMITINWAHRGAFASKQICNVEALKIIMNRLFEIRGNKVVWRLKAVNSMKPYSLHEFKVKALGLCEPRANEFVPNKASQWLNEVQKSSIDISTPPRYNREKINPMRERTKMMPITAYVGLMFKKPLMTEDATEVNLAGKILKFMDESRGRTMWMKICNNMLCGLPMIENLGKKEYDIGIQDSATEKIYRYQILVSVKRYPHAKNLNHRVSMNLYPMDKDFQAWYDLDNRLKLLRQLELYLDPNCDQGYGKSCGQGISFLRMVEKSGQKLAHTSEEVSKFNHLIEIDWAWTELYINGGCPRKRLQRLKEQLFTEESYSRIFHIGKPLQQIGLKTVAISVGYSGDCLFDDNESYTQSTLIASGDGGGFSTWKILIIVGAILVLIILPGAAFALFKMRNSRRSKKEGADAAMAAAATAAASRGPERSTARMKEREPLSKKPVHRPGMFNDEMDDAPLTPTKPLILPHEKPPVPPPDFGVMDLNCSRPTPSAPPPRSASTTMPRRPLNPYRNMPPNFDDRGARHV